MQNIGTIAALVISIIALFTSIYEANIMESQQKAMVWPYFKLQPAYNSEGFRLVASNKGTGPALIRSLEVSYKGKAMSSLDELLDAIKPDRTIGYEVIKVSEVNNNVFQNGESTIVLFLPWSDEVRQIVDKFNDVNVKVCYESVLGESWTYDMRADKHTEEKFRARVEYDN